MGKGLRDTPMLICNQVRTNANSRFTFKSWKSPLSNAENPGYA